MFIYSGNFYRHLIDTDGTMFKSITISLFLLSYLSFTACTTKVIVKADKTPLQQLQSDIDHLVKDSNLSNAHLGVWVAPLDNPKAIYAYNAHKIFVPASNMKLYTTAAALQNLGPDFRYRTAFYINGSLTDSTLHGDLIIKGAGDPTISGRFHDKDIFFDLKAWADSLRAKGIVKIDGNVIGDNSFFANDILGTGWEWDDESYYYAAQTSALAFNENCIDITAEGDSVAGNPARITINPRTDYVKIINRSTVTENDSVNTLEFSRERAKNTILIQGRFPKGAKAVEESITVENPALYLLTVFKQMLKEKGIEVTGKINVIFTKQPALYKNSNLAFMYESPKLADIIWEINKKSNNFYAEQLLKTMGALYRGKGSFKSGTDFIESYWESNGVADNELIMMDGSGLSRRNFISPASMAVLLRKMAVSNNFDVFFNSLPVSGVDGTLRHRMQGMRAAGRVHAKTGYVSNVRNLSGYVTDRKDRRYIFSILVNNYSVPTSYVNDLQDKICNLISEYGGD